MFETCLAVDHHVAIILHQAVKNVAQNVIGKAVAAAAFRTAHHNQVVSVLLDQGFLNAQLKKLLFGGTLQVLRFFARAFANAAHCCAEANAERLIEIGVRVGVDGEDERLSLAHEPVDDQGGKDGLAHSTLSGHCENHDYLVAASVGAATSFLSASLVWRSSEKTLSASATGREPVPHDGVMKACFMICSL